MESGEQNIVTSNECFSAGAGGGCGLIADHEMLTVVVLWWLKGAGGSLAATKIESNVEAKIGQKMWEKIPKNRRTLLELKWSN